MVSWLGITPARGFESIAGVAGDWSKARITPARGFESFGCGISDWRRSSITPARGFESTEVIQRYLIYLLYYPRKGV